MVMYLTVCILVLLKMEPSKPAQTRPRNPNKDFRDLNNFNPHVARPLRCETYFPLNIAGRNLPARLHDYTKLQYAPLNLIMHCSVTKRSIINQRNKVLYLIRVQ